MKQDYIPMILCGIIGFTVGGYLGFKRFIPKSSGLADEFLTVFIISSIGLGVGSLIGYTITLKYLGDA
jgi:hypothetical protein